MATREAVRTAFYSELESAVSGLVDSSNVSLQSPNVTEDLPAITHTDSYRNIPYNRGTEPSRIIRDSNGNVTGQEFTKVMEIRFICTIASESESETEQIYETVRSHFEEFETFETKNVEDIHSDASNISVGDANPSDDVERKPNVRGDALDIRIQYKRKHIESLTSIAEVNTAVDVDDGDTDEINKVTN
jgi:hypothetical protein